MSIDTNALLKASAVGAVVSVLITLCGYVVNFAVGISPGAVPVPGSLPPGYLIFSFCLGCVAYLIYGVYGAIYGFFARQNETPVEIGPYALGGAATGALVGLVSVVLGVIGLLISGPGIVSAFESSGLDFQGPAAVGGIIGGIIGLCIGWVIFIVLATVGAVIYAAIVGRSEPAAA